MNEIMTLAALVMMLWALVGAVRKPQFDLPAETDRDGRISWLKIPVGETIEFEMSSVVFATVETIRDALGYGVPPQAKDDAPGAIVGLGKGHGLKFGEWDVGGEFLTLSQGLVNDILRAVWNEGWLYEPSDDPEKESTSDLWIPPDKVSKRFEIKHVDDSGSRSYYSGRLV